jgi:hypothetical protein
MPAVTYCDSWTRCIEKRHFLGDGLLDALRNHQHPLLDNGSVATFPLSLSGI